jgi:LacI family transcriptional regulator
MSSPTPRRRASVTMADVAAAAGVAIGTVSNALNHPERVTDELLARVHKAIAELGFVRNSAARSLAAGSSSTVGFVLVDLANSLFVDMARGAERAAQDAGMYLVLANSDISVDKQATYLEHFSQEQVAGILLTLVAGDRSGLERARNAGRHVVILDADRVDDFCVVGTDYEQAGYLAAQHLISLGRTRLAFAGGPIWMSAIGDRLRGVERAVAENPGVTVTHLDSDEIQAEDGRLIGWRLADRRRISSRWGSCRRSSTATSDSPKTSPSSRATTTSRPTTASSRSRPSTSRATRWGSRRCSCCSRRSARGRTPTVG